MNYRTFGKLNWSVSEIGIGTWAFGGGGWGPQDDDDSRSALHTAIDHGINFIDTAQRYGGGRSEKIIGEVLKQRTEEIFVATKVPPQPGASPSFIVYPDAKAYYPRSYIIDQCEKSLRRLGREYIDVYQFHDWKAAFNRADELFDAMDQLKRDGKIRAAGVSVPDNTQDSVIRAIIDKRIDSVQILYNIFEQLPNKKLLPICEKYNIAVINRVPLFEGALTGKFSRKTRFHEDDFRNWLFGGNKMNILLDYIDKVESVKNLYCPDMSLAQYALRFCLSHPAVSTVIPGMRTMEQVNYNVTTINCGQCDERELEDLQVFGNVRTILKGETLLIRTLKPIMKKILRR